MFNRGYTFCTIKTTEMSCICVNVVHNSISAQSVKIVHGALENQEVRQNKFFFLADWLIFREFTSRFTILL